MRTHQTPPEVTDIILHGITSWFTQEQPPLVDTLSEDASGLLRTAVSEQGLIGWEHFIKGRLTPRMGFIYQL